MTRIQHLFSSTFLTKLPLFICLIGGLWLIAIVFDSYGFIRRADNGAFSAAQNSHQSAADPAEPIANLLAANWFGASPASQTQTFSAGPAQYQLKGVFMDMQHNASLAVIAEKDKSEKTYQIKDHLPDGSVVSGIFPEYITIKTAEGEKTLSLKAPF